MRSDLTILVREMARREAAAALLAAPLVEAGAQRPIIRVQLLACPTCGAREHERRWTPPFGDHTTDGPLLSMLACETITARAALPLVAATAFPVEQDRTPSTSTGFRTRAVTWLEVAHLPEDKALEAVDAAERWCTEPSDRVRGYGHTLPASTRRHLPDGTWSAYRTALAPSFLSPHPVLPDSVERAYTDQFRGAIVMAYERRHQDHAGARPHPG